MRLFRFYAAIIAVTLAAPAAAQSVLRDAETEAFFRDISKEMILGAGLDPRNVQIILVGDPSINAFVTGGQNIFIHSGLIAAADNVNELQGVIAHEIGHIAGGHNVRFGEGAGPATNISLLSLVGAAVLLSFNAFAIGTGLASLLVVAAYPFAKRYTFWPQAVLGLAFAWGGLMGWASAMGSLSAPAFLIYACAIFWTIGYDTIYALQDARDDAIAGVRSTARLFGDNVRAGVGAFYVAAVLAGALALYAVGAGALSWLGLAGFGAHLAWQVTRISKDDPASALMLFRANRNAGLILFAGLALDGLALSLFHS